MKDTLHYAHCVKFTIGQLDRHPYSLYESREVEIELKPIHSEDGPEWQVFYKGQLLACEQSLGDATAIAAYELMNKSRDTACHRSAELEIELNKGHDSQDDIR